MNATRTLAAVLAQARGGVAIEPLYLGEPGPGEILLRMEACGICHSDLFVAGLEKLPVSPITLGHEGIAAVQAVGQGVTGWAAGDRAGMTFLGTTCGACEWCAAGRERFCPKQTNFGYTLQGALSQFAIVPAAALVRVPAGLAAADAAPLCCAGWTAHGALREAALASGQSVALFGYGGLGHLALQIARYRGLRAVVADVSEEKLEQARAAGADLAVRAEDAGKKLQKEFGGVHSAIVLTASPPAVPQAFRALRRNGTLVLVGLSTSGYELPLVDTVLKGVTVRGSYLGSRQDLAAVFDMACAGRLRAHVEAHELAETPSVLERLRRGEVAGRAVIAF